MPEQRKRLHCVAEITLPTTFLLAFEVPAIAAFARSGLPAGLNGLRLLRSELAQRLGQWKVHGFFADDLRFHLGIKIFHKPINR